MSDILSAPRDVFYEDRVCVSVCVWGRGAYTFYVVLENTSEYMHQDFIFSSNKIMYK